MRITRYLIVVALLASSGAFAESNAMQIKPKLALSTNEAVDVVSTTKAVGFGGGVASFGLYPQSVGVTRLSPVTLTALSSTKAAGNRVTATASISANTVGGSTATRSVVDVSNAACSTGSVTVDLSGPDGWPIDWYDTYRYLSAYTCTGASCCPTTLHNLGNGPSGWQSEPSAWTSTGYTLPSFTLSAGQTVCLQYGYWSVNALRSGDGEDAESDESSEEERVRIERARVLSPVLACTR